MKRNMSLLRDVLFRVEDLYKGKFLRDLGEFDCDYQELIYHLELLDERGFINDYQSVVADGVGPIGFVVGGLSWYGQDYLELIRNDEVWKKTIEEVEDKKLPKTVEYLAKVAGKFTGAMISELNG